MWKAHLPIVVIGQLKKAIPEIIRAEPYQLCDHSSFIANLVDVHALDRMLQFVKRKRNFIQQLWCSGGNRGASEQRLQHVRKIICKRLLRRCRGEMFDVAQLLPITSVSQEAVTTARSPSWNLLSVKFANSEAQTSCFTGVSGHASTVSHLPEPSGITKFNRR